MDSGFASTMISALETLSQGFTSFTGSTITEAVWNGDAADNAKNQVTEKIDPKVEAAKEKLQKRLDAILNKDLHKYYNDEADHWFTVGHENGHSLGPKTGTEGLGKYKSIIEENKADMVSLSMVDILTEAGMYTPEQREQIIVTYAADNMMMSKPTLSQAHRVRSVMQNYFFTKEGAITISKEGILDINIEKMVPVARKMLEKTEQIKLHKIVKDIVAKNHKTKPQNINEEKDIQNQGHIADLGDIFDAAYAVHQQGGGQDAHCGVFGAADLDLTEQRFAAVNHIFIQGCCTLF